MVKQYYSQAIFPCTGLQHLQENRWCYLTWAAVVSLPKGMVLLWAQSRIQHNSIRYFICMKEQTNKGHWESSTRMMGTGPKHTSLHCPGLRAMNEPGVACIEKLWGLIWRTSLPWHYSLQHSEKQQECYGENAQGMNDSQPLAQNKGFHRYLSISSQNGDNSLPSWSLMTNTILLTFRKAAMYEIRPVASFTLQTVTISAL